ncbi:MAG: 50S ribosomal protein L9, partial [Clostridia bacterium]
MKVILNQDIKGIGKKFKTVEINDGYARNFLFPKKLATIADNTNLNESKLKLESIEYTKQTNYNNALEIKKTIEKKYIEFKHKTGENGKLFGSVTESKICEEILKKYNIKIDKKKITLEEPIKQIGSYIANIKLYEGVVAKLKINIIGM